MKRLLATLLLVSLIPLTGCGRGGPTVVVDKKPIVESTVAEPSADERLKAIRKAAEDIDKSARDAGAIGKNRAYSVNMMWAAAAWLKAEDKDKALAAAKAAIDAGPDDSSPINTFRWHTNIAEVLAATDEIPLAVQQYEAALKAAPDPISASRTGKKLAEMKAKIAK